MQVFAHIRHIPTFMSKTCCFKHVCLVKCKSDKNNDDNNEKMYESKPNDEEHETTFRKLSRKLSKKLPKKIRYMISTVIILGFGLI